MLDTFELDELIQIANRLDEAGDHLKEIEIYKVLVREGLIAFYLNIGLARLELDDIDGARAAFSAGAGLDLYDCSYELALLDQDAGDLGRAQHVFQRLSDAGYRPATFALGNLLHQNGDNGRAVDALLPLASADDEFGVASAGVLGVIFAGRGDLDRAIPFLRKGASVYPPAADLLDGVDSK